MITTREIEDLLIKAADANDVKAQEDLNNELNRREALPDEERTQYGQDVFNDAQARTSGQPSQLELNKGDGNFQGSFTGSMLQGGRDILDAGAQMMYNAVPESVQQAGNQANDWLAENTGLVGKMPEGNLNYKIQQDEANYQEQRRRAGRGGFDGGRLLGNVLATAPLLAAKPFQMVNAGKDVFNAANLARGMGQGGAFGLSQPVLNGGDNFWLDKSKQFGVGAAGGGGGALLGNMLSRVVKPNVVNYPANRLREQGVTPTGGGMLGGGYQVFEDKATSLPIVGTAINSAKKKAQEELNRAVYKRALVDTGVDASKLPVGRKGVKAVKEAISKQYDELLPKISFKPDATFKRDLDKFLNGIDGLFGADRQKFDNILNYVKSKSSPSGSMTGKTFKIVQSELINKYRKHNATQGGFELGGAIQQLEELMKQQVMRSYPKYAEDLKRVNKNYSAYAVIREAGAKTGDQTAHGFTPANLASAVRSNDKSLKKGNYSSGQANMQDLSDDAISALGSKYPDSGTAGRLIGSIGGAASMFNPQAIQAALIAAGGLGAASLPYLARKTTADFLTKRPQSAKAFARALRKVSPATGAVGAVGSQ